MTSKLIELTPYTNAKDFLAFPSFLPVVRCSCPLLEEVPATSCLTAFFLFSGLILCIIQLTLYYVCIIIQLIIYLYIAQLCSTNFQFNLFMYYSSFLRSSGLHKAQHLFFLTRGPPKAFSFIFSVPIHFLYSI